MGHGSPERTSQTPASRVEGFRLRYSHSAFAQKVADVFMQRLELWQSLPSCKDVRSLTLMGRSVDRIKGSVSFEIWNDDAVIQAAEDEVAQSRGLIISQEMVDIFDDFIWGTFCHLREYLSKNAQGPRPSLSHDDIPDEIYISKGFYDPVRRFETALSFRAKLRDHENQIHGGVKAKLDPIIN